MKQNKKPSGYYRLLAGWRRTKRLLFPSPAEIELIRVMGGKVIVIDLVRERLHGYPLCFVVSIGDTFKKERMAREVRVGAFYLDFGNDIQRGIEVDGKPWHGDIIREQRRNEYVGRYGWILLHIPAADLYQNPKIVRERVLQFLGK